MRVLLLSETEAKNTLYCALKGGHDVVVAGNLDRNRLLRFHPGIVKFVPLESSLRDADADDALIDEILAIVRRERIEVLLPSSFDCIRILSRFRTRLAAEVAVVPTPLLENIELLDDKANFHRFCVERGFPHPTSYLLTELTESSIAAIQRLTFPVMLKPPMGAGGDGLEVIATLDALRDRFERPGPEGAPELPTLVQEYFDGEDIDFNAFVLGGDCRASSVMWTRFHERSPRFSITEFAEHEEARRLAERLLGEVAFNGPVNIDMRIRADDGSVQFIEVNPRFWARTPQALVDGINFIESGIRAAVGNPSVQSSSGSRVPWPSSLVRPVVAFLRYRDPALLQMLLRLSSIQIRYLTYTQLYLAYAKVRSRLAREPSSEPSSQSAR